MLISDGGELKRADFSVVRDAVFNDVSGDAAIAAGGVLTLNTVTVPKGGTGATSFTAGNILIGDGVNAITSINMSTKGGILVGDGSGAPSVLSVGDDDYVLTADSSQATGVKWAASAGAVSGNTFATDLKIGRDSDNHIDFTTDNQIHVNVNNGQKISVKDN